MEHKTTIKTMHKRFNTTQTATQTLKRRASEGLEPNFTTFVKKARVDASAIPPVIQDTNPQQPSSCTTEKLIPLPIPPSVPTFDPPEPKPKTPSLSDKENVKNAQPSAAGFVPINSKTFGFVRTFSRVGHSGVGTSSVARLRGVASLDMKPATQVACNLYGRIRTTIVSKEANDSKSTARTANVEDSKLPLKKRKNIGDAVTITKQTTSQIVDKETGTKIGITTKRVGEVTRPNANKNALLYVF